MRWDNLTRKNLTRSTRDALFGVDAIVERAFETREFRGMTFYEVRARSIINKVPGTSRVPFGRTINPYRGCSHACRYCLPGDTPILMADGRTTPLADLRVGDAISGTTREGRCRKYAITEVLAHWQTVKPAHRIMLADGTELVASGDHSFRTDCGWKHVTAQPGDDRLPHLGVGDAIIGTGRFAASPGDSTDYRRGYLCGIVRGDPHLGLGLLDREALRRVGGYFMDAAAHTRRPVLQPAAGPWEARAVSRSQAQAGFEVIAEMISWPRCPDDVWRKGFLAGIFDAEGSCSGGLLRIVNSADQVIGSVLSSLTALGFAGVAELEDRSVGTRAVRLLGGADEQLRFLRTVDPAISRKRSIAGMAITGRVRVVAIEDLGVMLPIYDITTGTGDFIANGMVSLARRHGVGPPQEQKPIGHGHTLRS